MAGREENLFNYYDQPARPTGQPGQATRVRLSQEEIKTLRECNRESFYYRCLPFSTVAMALTHMAVRAGYLNPNPRWGSTLKVLGAGMVGFVIGKFSYQSKCIEKIMQLPNSSLGDALRNRQRRGTQEMIEIDATDVFTLPQPTPKEEEPPSYKYEPIDRIGVDLDTNIIYEGLDDSLRPTVDSQAAEPQETPPPASSSYTTYDELRAKNRAEYEAKRRESYKTSPPMPIKLPPPPSTPPPPPPPSPAAAPTESTPVKRTGKYGDVWDD